MQYSFIWTLFSSINRIIKLNLLLIVIALAFLFLLLARLSKLLHYVNINTGFYFIAALLYFQELLTSLVTYTRNLTDIQWTFSWLPHHLHVSFILTSVIMGAQTFSSLQKDFLQRFDRLQSLPPEHPLKGEIFNPFTRITVPHILPICIRIDGSLEL